MRFLRGLVGRGNREREVVGFRTPVVFDSGEDYVVGFQEAEGDPKYRITLKNGVVFSDLLEESVSDISRRLLDEMDILGSHWPERYWPSVKVEIAQDIARGFEDFFRRQGKIRADDKVDIVANYSELDQPVLVLRTVYDFERSLATGYDGMKWLVNMDNPQEFFEKGELSQAGLEWIERRNSGE